MRFEIREYNGRTQLLLTRGLIYFGCDMCTMIKGTRNGRIEDAFVSGNLSRLLPNSNYFEVINIALADVLTWTARLGEGIVS